MYTLGIFKICRDLAPSFTEALSEYSVQSELSKLYCRDCLMCRVCWASSTELHNLLYILWELKSSVRKLLLQLTHDWCQTRKYYGVPHGDGIGGRRKTVRCARKERHTILLHYRNTPCFCAFTDGVSKIPLFVTCEKAQYLRQATCALCPTMVHWLQLSKDNVTKISIRGTVGWHWIALCITWPAMHILELPSYIAFYAKDFCYMTACSCMQVLHGFLSGHFLLLNCLLAANTNMQVPKWPASVCHSREACWKRAFQLVHMYLRERAVLFVWHCFCQ